MTRCALAVLCVVTALAARPAAERAPGLDQAIREEMQRGDSWQSRGFPYPAILHFERALDLALQAGTRSTIASIYGALGSAYGDLGQWDRVLDFAERQHDTVPRQTPDTEFQYQFLRGTAFFEFQDREQADVSLRQALVAARSTNNPRQVSMALGELAGVAMEFDHDLPRAMDAYAEALSIARENRLTDLEATWLLDSGAALRESGDYAAARTRFEAALALARAAGTRRIAPAAHKNLAQVLLKEGRRPDAIAMLTLARRESDEQDLSQLRWETRVELAVLARTTDPDAAERLFDEALDILEDTQGSVLVEQLRTGALRRALASVDPYDLAIDFLLERGNVTKAFLVAERGRARAFLEALRLAGDRIAEALPVDYLEAEATLLNDISEAQTAMRLATIAPSERQSLQLAIQSDEEKLNALRLRLSADRPAVAAARYARVWTAGELQERLSPGQALMMFFVGSRQSVAWILTAKGLTSQRLEPGTRIDAAARRYLDRALQPNAAGEPEAASDLFRLLVPDPAALSGIDHLVVVPHGALFGVPFEALRDEDGHRLIERFPVEYAASASSFVLLSERRDPLKAGAVWLGIGNPVMSQRAAAPTRQVGVEHLSLLAPLPFTGEELAGISRIFGRSARVFEGAGATERALRQADLSSVSIVHFATHGLIDEQRPDRSALVLTAEAPDDDGVLQVREVYGLHLHDALVTLSACDTALGQNVRGEGIIGLSRAFFYAGANAVVASMWSVNDRSAAAFMTEFYRGLGEGDTAASALRNAKLKFLHDGGDWSAPYHWATFVVLGNGGWSGAPPTAQNTMSAVPAWVVLLAFAGAGAWSATIWRARRNAKRAAPGVSPPS